MDSSSSVRTQLLFNAVVYVKTTHVSHLRKGEVGVDGMITEA